MTTYIKMKKKTFFIHVYLKKHLQGTRSKLESDEFIEYICKMGPFG